METQSSLNNSILETEDSINIREQIENYLIHWKWFLFSLFLALSIAIVFFRYSIPLYNSSTTILIKDDRKGGIQTELSAFSDLGLMGSKSSIENEIEVLKSRTLIERIVKKLGLNVSYFSQGRIKTVEKYKDSPVYFNFFEQSESFFDKNSFFNINSISSNKFELIEDETNKLGVFSFGDIIVLRNAKLIITKNINKNILNEQKFSLFITVDKVINSVQSYKGRLVISPVGKNTNIVELTISDPIKERADFFLNNLIKIYNEEAIEDKNYISKKTVDFIDNRIRLITDELSGVEKDVEGFKNTNRFVNLESEANLYLQNTSEFEMQLNDIETQLIITKSLSDFARDKPIGELMPTNIAPFESNTSEQIAEYNALILNRNRLIKEGSNKSPIVNNLNQKIDELNFAIKQSLSRLKTNLTIKKSSLNRQINVVENKISKIPNQTRLLRGIERQQQIKESLYLYLLQKREETAIALAVTAPNIKVIDTAYSSSNPISPNKNLIYLIAIFCGFAVPFAIIYVSQLLDTKLKTRLDLEKSVTVPFIGDVTRSQKNDEIVNTNDRSSTAESLRIVRTNLEFLLSQVPEGKAKTIFVTSTIPKEGKTFIAINLASTIALSGKRVAILGMDIRNPQVGKYVDLPTIGITNYLSKPNQDINDYLFKINGYENFYGIAAGTIPPNPAELLMSDKVKEMFIELKNNFDYIIVDTAPISLVTDTLIISKNADAFIYVARSNYLQKNLLKIPETLYRDKKLPNMSILLNDTVRSKRIGYGYSYGYAYGYSNFIENENILTKIYNKLFKG